MNKLLLLLTLIFTLSGCESEVDKCVSAQMDAWKDRSKANEEILEKKKEQGPIKLSDIWDLVPNELESEVVAKARLACLKASGKN
jgi:hypothetical protein